MLAVRVVVAVACAVVVLLVLFEALRVFVIPHSSRPHFSRLVFTGVFRLLQRYARTGRARDRASADAIMAHAAPLGVVALPLTWLFATLVAYAGIFWSVDGGGFGNAFVVSGSSLFTLGFDRPSGVGGAGAAFAEAAVGLALVAMVISYLPTLNAAFARREAVVAMLDARAGVPPDGVTLIERHHVFAGIAHLDEQWGEWERWIVEVGESHTSHPMLIFFRSSIRAHSWVTAATALLDGANLRLSAIQASGAGNASAWMFYRAATGVLDRIGASFLTRTGEAATAVSRTEFDRVLDRFDDAGVSLVDDRDLAWERFARRRSAYEPTVTALATLVDATLAPWWAEAGRVANSGGPPPS
jgi:hypothetical protein